MGYVVDMVVDGADRQRAAFVISEEHAAIADDVMYEMGRGVTELAARGVWSGKDRPMLLIILGKREVSILKTIVAEHDPEAIMFFTDVTEAVSYTHLIACERSLPWLRRPTSSYASFAATRSRSTPPSCPRITSARCAASVRISSSSSRSRLLACMLAKPR